VTPAYYYITQLLAKSVNGLRWYVVILKSKLYLKGDTDSKHQTLLGEKVYEAC